MRSVPPMLKPYLNSHEEHVTSQGYVFVGGFDEEPYTTENGLETRPQTLIYRRFGDNTWAVLNVYWCVGHDRQWVECLISPESLGEPGVERLQPV